ncbi:MAG: hypothetical protein AAGH76_12755 [Pseudomonadota bacterium]
MSERNFTWTAGRAAATAATVLLATLPSIAGATNWGAEYGYGDWLETVPVDGVAGGCPIESFDARTLWTASGRGGTLDVWTYERKRKKGPFTDGPNLVGDPVSLPDADDFCPTPIGDRWLFFVSDRPGGCGGVDMYIVRLPKHGRPNYAEAKNLGCAKDGGPNTAGRELAPAFVRTEAGTFLYYSSDIDGSQDIYVSNQSMTGEFGVGQPVHELNGDAADQQPNVRRDGLEIVFSSNRDGGGQDVFIATRTSVYEPFGDVRNLTEELDLPTVDGNETRASLSRDGYRLYYGSGGTIFVTEREQIILSCRAPRWWRFFSRWFR